MEKEQEMGPQKRVVSSKPNEKSVSGTTACSLGSNAGLALVK